MCPVNYAYSYEKLRKKIRPLFAATVGNAKRRVYFAKRLKNLTTKRYGLTICHNSSNVCVHGARRAVRKWMKDDERKSKEAKRTRNRGEYRRAKNKSIIYGLSIYCKQTKRRPFVSVKIQKRNRNFGSGLVSLLIGFTRKLLGKNDASRIRQSRL